MWWIRCSHQRGAASTARWATSGSWSPDKPQGVGYRLGSLKGRPTIPPKFSPELQRRIMEAREHLAVAERELEAALSELKVAERADKKMISERLEIAFAKLAAARQNLEAILQEEG